MTLVDLAGSERLDEAHGKSVNMWDESDEAINYCFANYKVLKAGNLYKSKYKAELPKKMNLHELLRFNIMPITLSVVFRAKELPFPFPNFVMNSFNADWVFLFLIAGKGKIGYIKDEVGVYRKGIGIITNTQSSYKFINGLQTNQYLNQYTLQEYNYYLGKKEWHLENITYAYFHEKKIAKGFSKIPHKLFYSYRENSFEDFFRKNHYFLKHIIKLFLTNFKRKVFCFV